MKAHKGIWAGIALLLLVLGGGCGEAGQQELAGTPGSTWDGGPVTSFSPELYDACREVYGSFSPGGLRFMWEQSGELSELSGLSDEDVRGLFRLMCLALATVGGTAWNDTPLH